MPKPSKSIAKSFALKVAFVYRKIHRFVAWITGYLGLPVSCDIYFAIEHENGTSVKGRAMRVRHVREPDPDDSRIRNCFEILKNGLTPERPFTEVRVSLGNCAKVVTSDRDGYFDCDFEGIPEGKPVIIEIPTSTAEPVEIHPVTYCPETSEYLLISDIDDTLLVTNAGRTLRMIATTLLGNALTRQIFPGTSALYRGLKQGTISEGHPHINPVCYVSSSPFNLHRLVSLIFKYNDIPGGAFFMAAWGLDETKWFRHNHHTHKLAAIQIAMSWYPSLPVILIGDSGEHDTDIYAEVARQNPDRILDVLIRNVSSEEKIENLREGWAENVSDDNFFVFNDSLEATNRLHERGRITESVVAAVEKEIEESEESILATLIEPIQKHRK